MQRHADFAQGILTAGHCTESPAAHVEIWFAADVESGIPANGYPFAGDVGGTPQSHDYNPNFFTSRDVGVVVLDEPVEMSTYGILPQLNQLDTLANRRGRQDRTFTAVGYGLRAFPMRQHGRKTMCACVWSLTRT
ncbi:MAG: hypothetical protein U0694_03245 [Anaerolineae bacterium]